MKKSTFLFLYVIIGLFMLSCETDGGTSVLEVEEGAVPDITPNSEYPTILNLNTISTGENITFGFTVDIALGDVSSADVVGFYQTVDGDIYGPVTFVSNVTEFPADFTLSTSDLVAEFEELNDLSDFQLADNLIITTRLYLEDGRVLEMFDNSGRLYGSDIHTSTLYSVVANYPVGCPLNGAFTGSYQVTVSGPTSGFGDFSTSPTFTVELEEDSQTTRSFDMEYLSLYAFEVSPTLEFICDRVVWQPTGSGVGCGGGEITFGSSDSGAVIDPSDDSEFTLVITDFLTDGGCGVPAREITATFEKL